jgi:hypothetical protein
VRLYEQLRRLLPLGKVEEQTREVVDMDDGNAPLWRKEDQARLRHSEKLQSLLVPWTVDGGRSHYDPVEPGAFDQFLRTCLGSSVL